MATAIAGSKNMDRIDMARAAFGYLRRGWSVIPVEAGGKRPLVRWEDYQHRRADADEVRHWYQRWPGAGIGIVTGVISGLVVLDIDPPHGGDDSLDDLEHRYSVLVTTIEAITGGGGRHVYFKHPGGTVRNRVGLAPGIDLRGDGGMVVAPPSLHPSGRRYAWEMSHHPDDTAPAPLPAWLLGAASAEAPHRGHTSGYWRDLVRRSVAEGERNDTVASFAGHLLWRGVDAEVATDLLLCWNRARCRPPLSDAEVVRTVESILRTQLRHRPDVGPGD